MKFLLRNKWLIGTFVFGCLLGFVMGILSPWMQYQVYQLLNTSSAKGRMAKSIREKGFKELRLVEGLPHQLYERELLEQEKSNKPVQEIHGYFFYKELPDSRVEVMKDLQRILGNPNAYGVGPGTGRKKCGGFHPDFAITWQDNNANYYAFLCFGCDEVKFFGPHEELYYDLKLGEVMKQWMRERCRKNRPESLSPRS